MKLHVGVIGLGDHWESRYRPALAALSDRFDVRGIYSPVSLLAEKAAQSLGASVADGFRSLVARPDIDAVLVLSCHWCGPLPILAACEAGKSLYCAADLDIDLDQTLALQDRIVRSGVAFMAELPRRLAPATVRLKELIATRLGQPRMLFCHQRAKTNPRRNGSRCEPGLDDARTHLVELVDWCRYVVDCEPSAVFGVEHHPAGVADDGDYYMLSLDFSKRGQSGTGPLAQISSGTYIKDLWPEAITFRPPSQLQVCCERGVAFLDLPATLIWFDEAGSHTESLESERPIGEHLLRHFHRAVTSLVRKTSDLEDACRAIRIVLAAKESFRLGQRVSLDWQS